VLVWASLHPEHAIERVRFEISFSDLLPQKVLERIGIIFDGKRSQIRFEPRVEHSFRDILVGEVPSNNVQFDSFPIRKGWRSVRMGSGNTVIEAVTMLQNSLVYESADYRSWKMAMSRFISVCGDLIDEAEKSVNAALIIHDYTDRFVFQGVPADAVPELLLKREILPQIPADILSGQDLWHVHRGWFEYQDGEKYLVNQNFDAQQGMTLAGFEARSVQIYTKLELRAEAGPIELSTVATKFIHMHNRCNELVANALTVDMATKIGLGKKGKAFDA
jgi:hypothetical protein